MVPFFDLYFGYRMWLHPVMCTQRLTFLLMANVSHFDLCKSTFGLLECVSHVYLLFRECYGAFFDLSLLLLLL